MRKAILLWKYSFHLNNDVKQLDTQSNTMATTHSYILRHRSDESTHDNNSSSHEVKGDTII